MPGTRTDVASHAGCARMTRAVLLAMVLVTACTRVDAQSDPPPTPRSAPTATRSTSSSTVSDLVVPSFSPTVVVAPSRSGRRPVIVVLHGMGDRAESICPAFADLVQGRAWIVCPRGTRYQGAVDRWTYSNDRTVVLTEINAALRALSLREPERADIARPILSGFSFGAWLVSQIALHSASEFPRAFAMDTHAVWSREQQSDYAHHGGRAALFSCTRDYIRDCRARCRETTTPLRLGCSTMPTLTHGYGHAYFEALRDRFEQLLATDSRFQ